MALNRESEQMYTGAAPQGGGGGAMTFFFFFFFIINCQLSGHVHDDNS